MEILPGAFEREWERRRAVLMHEMQLGQVDKGDWEEPRRGGVARLPEVGAGGFGRGPRRGDAGNMRGGRGGRSMRTRFSALARGSQPAVVKLASYGGGSRAGAMMSYTSRGGEIAVENERGERILGKDALAEQRAGWEHLFDNRTASRDLGVFHVSVDASSLRDDVDQDDQLREILRSGFGDRRFVYASRERGAGELHVSGVVVLRSGDGERLTGDRKAAEIVQQRFDISDSGRDVEARFRFHGYGNGVEWGTARVRELVAGTDGEVRDDTGRLIGDATQAGDLLQKDWRSELHSRKGRDIMHLIVSARAGTDGAAFEGAVREFLGEQFAGHRYIFAVHDPALDPKEMAEGGKRPHIHAHAIVTMRSETRERIVTSPQTFREWRSLMAEKAREQGIDMELTDRRDFANAPAYTRNQVRPVSYRGRTEHEGTSAAAHSRYRAKRTNEIKLATTNRSRQYAAQAARAWNDLASETPDAQEGNFAALQITRLEGVCHSNQNDIVFRDQKQRTVENAANMIELNQIVNGEDGQMWEMTRPEFEAYEKRVEGVLDRVGSSIDEVDRKDFEEVAAAALEVVGIRREYLELSERQAGVGEAPHDRQILRDSGVHEGVVPVEVEATEAQQGIRATHEGENRVESVREISPTLTALHQRYFNENLDNAARDRAGAQQLMDHVVESYPKDQLRDDTDLGEVADHYVREHFPNETPARQNEIAARIEEANEIRQGYYSTWRELEAEAAAGDPDVLGWQAEMAFERKQDEERDAAYNEGFEGRPIPDIAKGNGDLLAKYEQGLRALEMEIAVTDVENGIGSVGWGRVDGSWTRQDSEAAWENYNRRSSELQAFLAEQEQRAQRREGPATAAESASDDRAQERHRDDERASPPEPDEIARERDGNLSGPERQQVSPAVVRDGPERTADAARSDPPQQHVPRLQELEREIEERRERDRDDRER
ncbi:relaxase/mobilization nuclease domain-containing protein [Tianweitania sediminis]|uniref:Conjugal transfer protein TraA n=1 Tax=Tianweitania sediminis TaxID=1502156 RepID=A0A8J7R3Q7_9HYPH|nr:hypothetical protein [Tianweitania sediminis]MBP0440428.1 hypothetical protein [Tianweitania sediminis]